MHEKVEVVINIDNNSHHSNKEQWLKVNGLKFQLVEYQ